MTKVNMLEAKTNLSKLVDAVESGREREIIIARNGRPAAKLVAISEHTHKPRALGLLDGQFRSMSLEEFNADDEEIARTFNDGEI